MHRPVFQIQFLFRRRFKSYTERVDEVVDRVVRETGDPELRDAGTLQRLRTGLKLTTRRINALSHEAGTADLDKLNADLKRVLDSKDMQESMPPRGFLPAYSTPEELASVIRQDLARWKDVTDRIGLKID